MLRLDLIINSFQIHGAELARKCIGGSTMPIFVPVTVSRTWFLPLETMNNDVLFYHLFLDLLAKGDVWDFPL